MDGNVKDKPQSEFNMAVSYLSQLNMWFFRAGEASANLDAFNWYHSLMVLFRQLSTEMNDTELTKWNAESEQINNMIMREIISNKRNRTQGISPTLYKKLHEFELYLRNILKRAGLQTKLKDDFMSSEEQW